MTEVNWGTNNAAWDSYKDLNSGVINDLTKLLNNPDVKFEDGILSVGGQEIALSDREQIILDLLVNDDKTEHGWRLNVNELMNRYGGDALGEWSDATEVVDQFASDLQSLNEEIAGKMGNAMGAQSGEVPLYQDAMTQYQEALQQLYASMMQGATAQGFDPSQFGFPGPQTFPQVNPYGQWNAGQYPSSTMQGAGPAQMMMMMLLMNTMQQLKPNLPTTNSQPTPAPNTAQTSEVDAHVVVDDATNQESGIEYSTEMMAFPQLRAAGLIPDGIHEKVNSDGTYDISVSVKPDSQGGVLSRAREVYSFTNLSESQRDLLVEGQSKFKQDLQVLIDKFSELKDSIKALVAKVGDDHPMVKTLENRLKAVGQEINDLQDNFKDFVKGFAEGSTSEASWQDAVAQAKETEEASPVNDESSSLNVSQYALDQDRVFTHAEYSEAIELLKVLRDLGGGLSPNKKRLQEGQYILDKLEEMGFDTNSLSDGGKIKKSEVNDYISDLRAERENLA